MILTEKWLVDNKACKEGIEFCERGKLFGFPFSMIKDIKGEYHGFINWIRNNRENVLHYDSHNRVKCVASPFHNDIRTYTYDDNNNIICEQLEMVDNEDSISSKTEFFTYFEYNNNKISKEYDSYGGSTVYSYNDKGNLVHVVTTNNNNEYNFCHEYDAKNRVIYTKQHDITDSHATKSESWIQYNDLDNSIYERYSNGSHYWKFFDDKHNMIKIMFGVEIKKTNPTTTDYDFSILNDEYNTYEYDEERQMKLCTRKLAIEYYDDEQLKQYNRLIIPYFNK